MKTPIYLIYLSGQGDVHMKLVDKPTWDWIINGGNVPNEVVFRYAEEYGMSQVAAKQELSSVGRSGSSQDNDRALSAPPAKINGKTFDNYSGTNKALNAFLATHSLEIIEEFEGYIY